MRLLLDTHALLWWIDDDKRLPIRVRSLLEEASNEIYVSVVNVWEMAIKGSTGKLNLPQDFSSFIANQLDMNGFNVLSVHLPHVTQVYALPDIHRDPFDRLLIAQAMVEKMPLLTNDSVVKQYGLETLW